MAGPYAHLTLLHELVNSLDPSPTGSPMSQVVSAVQTHFPFCALGGVSPDFPNLSQDPAGVAWSDAMHYVNSGEIITRGVPYVRNAPAEIRPKLLAWLLGYCAHVVSDLTIHPVVRIKVGDYTENRRRHRICEMNQDSHIFSRMNLGEIRDADTFTRDILACREGGGDCLDGDMAAMWESLLRDTHPGLYAKNHPAIQEWFSRYNALASSPDGQSGHLFPLAALISADIGRDYPVREMIETRYVGDLTVPGGRIMGYDQVFTAALENVRRLWVVVGEGVAASGDRFPCCIGNWNLDTGQDEEGRIVLWDSPTNE
jgi:hypothetical protein